MCPAGGRGRPAAAQACCNADLLQRSVRCPLQQAARAACATCEKPGACSCGMQVRYEVSLETKRRARGQVRAAGGRGAAAAGGRAARRLRRAAAGACGDGARAAAGRARAAGRHGCATAHARCAAGAALPVAFFLQFLLPLLHEIAQIPANMLLCIFKRSREMVAAAVTPRRPLPCECVRWMLSWPPPARKAARRRMLAMLHACRAHYCKRLGLRVTTACMELKQSTEFASRPTSHGALYARATLRAALGPRRRLSGRASSCAGWRARWASGSWRCPRGRPPRGARPPHSWSLPRCPRRTAPHASARPCRPPKRCGWVHAGP